MSDTKRGSMSKDAPANGPVRTCIVTRSARPAAELLRFVAGPDGAVVPDLQGRLPGRGAWVTCSKMAVADAVRRKAFARALEQQVATPADLADRVERLLVKRALDTLSLANKAGLVVTGFTRVEAAIGQGSVAVLLHGSEAAEDGRLKLDRLLDAASRRAKKPVRVCRELTVEQLSLALGRPNVVHACLSTGGATAMFLAEVERLARYRSAADLSNPGLALAGLPQQGD
ncbi:MAG TPA: RNA-binding protein [Hyphomicrobiaceae bacterium]|nr:RNA-binding protein [Hyphomicrobiaceae bacterium]